MEQFYKVKEIKRALKYADAVTVFDVAQDRWGSGKDLAERLNLDMIGDSIREELAEVECEGKSDRVVDTVLDVIVNDLLEQVLDVIRDDMDTQEDVAALEATLQTPVGAALFAYSQCL